MNQDIQGLLLQIVKKLDDQNVNDIVFLCGDTLTTTEKKEIEEDPNKLFTFLQRKGLLSKENVSFLKEILYKIGRIDILTEELSTISSELKELQNSPKYISTYRSLLYDISHELDSKDVKNVKFHLYPKLAKLKHTVSMLDVLNEMEKDLTVSATNLVKLKETLSLIGREDLRKRIESFQNQAAEAAYDCTQEKLPIQENPTNQPMKLKAGSGKGMSLEQYNLDKEPHGWCLILNNEDFEKAGRNEKNEPILFDRHGTNKDAEAIKRVFKKRNYIVKEHKNLIGEEMLNIMEKYRKTDHSDEDSFICFILSHGDQGIVFGVDGKEVSIKQLTSCFNGQKCPTLNGKPKIFFIQACQGDEFDGGVPYEEDSCTSSHESDGGSLPTPADFLIAYASSEDYVSLRNGEGSVYIQKLCKALEHPDFVQYDLKDILTVIQKEIGDEQYNVNNTHVKQMPSYKSQLRKKLILPPSEETQNN